MDDIRTQLAYVGRMLFERRLADMAGGNISARQGDHILISPRYSGSQRHWQLSPEDFVEGPIATDEVLSHPLFSREGRAHLAIYRNFPEALAILHAHPFHVMPFCAAGREIPPVLEQTQKFGVVRVAQGAPAHSPQLAEYVVQALRGQEQTMRKQAAAVLLPQHGIFVAGKDLLAALDALERIDWNAWCILAQRLLP